MKRNIIITLIMAVLLSACGPAPMIGGQSSKADSAGNAAGLKVLAVESFIADMAQNVAGDRLKVDSLMPLGVDPHVFEPTPQDVAKIAGSDILIVNGGGLEAWLQEILDNAGGRHTIIEASVGLDSRAAREGEEAVMSEAEKEEALCAALAEKKAVAEKQAGEDRAHAAELLEAHTDQDVGHLEAEFVALKLNEQTSGGYGGFVRLDVEEPGDFMLATAQGVLKVMTPEGKELPIEETLAPDCSGVSQAMIIELEKGEYLLALSGFQQENTPILAGPPTGQHHHHQGDPHYWLDPLMAVKYVEAIHDGLSQADPQGKDVYKKNADAYISRLRELDQSIAQQVSTIPAEKRLIVTNHESFGYFADRYGFKIIGTIVPSVSSDASPSAQQLARLVERIKATKATAIFLETGTNPQLARQISAETGVKVITELYTHSISRPDGDAPTYIDMMKYNVRTIVDALK